MRFFSFFAKKNRSAEKSREYIGNEAQKARLKVKTGVVPQYQQKQQYMSLMAEEIANSHIGGMKCQCNLVDDKRKKKSY